MRWGSRTQITLRQLQRADAAAPSGGAQRDGAPPSPATGIGSADRGVWSGAAPQVSTPGGGWVGFPTARQPPSTSRGSFLWVHTKRHSQGPRRPYCTAICGRYKFRKIQRRRAAGSWARPTGRNPSLSRALAGATSWLARHAGAPVMAGGCQTSRLTHNAATGLSSTGQATHPTVATVAALPRTACVYAPVAAPERGPWPAWASHADKCVVVGWPQRAVAVRHPTPSAEAQSGGPGGATGVSS